MKQKDEIYYCSIKGCKNTADKFTGYCDRCFVKVVNAFIDIQVLGNKQKRGFR
jgi:hypothetical protein